jgi:hypothetical protein
MSKKCNCVGIQGKRGKPGLPGLPGPNLTTGITTYGEQEFTTINDQFQYNINLPSIAFQEQIDRYGPLYVIKTKGRYLINVNYQISPYIPETKFASWSLICGNFYKNQSIVGVDNPATSFFNTSIVLNFNKDDQILSQISTTTSVGTVKFTVTGNFGIQLLVNL